MTCNLRTQPIRESSQLRTLRRLSMIGAWGGNTAFKETWSTASVTSRLISTNSIDACRTLSCGARVTRNVQVCRVRQPIAQPPHHRGMVGFDARGLVRRQLVAPSAGLAATEEARTRLRRRLPESLFLFLLSQSGEVREFHCAT